MTVLVTGACINTGVDIVEKFATEGWDVVFTGRNAETVHAKEKEYREQFPEVKIIGFHIDSLIDERTVNEKAVEEMFEYFDGRVSFEMAVDKIKQASRNYAKRQNTWFKRDERIVRLSPESAFKEAFDLIRKEF